MLLPIGVMEDASGGINEVAEHEGRLKAGRRKEGGIWNDKSSCLVTKLTGRLIIDHGIVLLTQLQEER